MKKNYEEGEKGFLKVLFHNLLTQSLQANICCAGTSTQSAIWLHGLIEVIVLIFSNNNFFYII